MTFDGVKVPCGKLLEIEDASLALQYNEFIVYDTSQVKMRYIVQVKFNPR
jgi:poly [ADP-ribose] polymerase